MPAIRVRAAEPADIPAIHEIFTCPKVIAGTLQLPYPSIEQTRERFTRFSAGSVQLVAEVDGRVMGILGLHSEENPRRRHAAMLGMAVHDDFQGQGVGSALVASALDLADNWLGLRRIELQVFVDNTAAVHLYQKFGFEIEGTLREFALRDGVYVDAYAMARLRR
jgi:putative acetyltransferase